MSNKVSASPRLNVLAARVAAVFDNSDLGEFVVNSPSGVSPQVDQPVMLANNITLNATYNFGHTALGSQTYAGTHLGVLLAPDTSAVTQTNVWQIRCDPSQNNIPVSVPPTGVGTTITPLVNTSALALANGTTWSYTPTTVIPQATATVTIVCPSGSNTINVFINIAYGGTTTVLTPWLIPLQDASGNQTSFGVPISAVGSCAYTLTGYPNGWVISNGAGSSSSTPTAYADSINLVVGASSIPVLPFNVSCSFTYLGS